MDQARGASTGGTAASMDRRRDAVVAAGGRVGGGHRDITSGAGHDACDLAGTCPTAMVFVPSRDGISHNPTEWSSPEWCEAGANVLLQATLELAG